MNGLRRLWRTLSDRGRFERELDDELAFHADARARDLERSGLSPAEAARRARIELGMVESHKEEYRAAFGLAPFDGLAGDLRHALRTLSRNPGFSATAVLILALAIAANAALFAFFDTYVMQGPQVRAADRLVDVHAGYRDGQVGGSWSLDDAQAFADAETRAFEGLFLTRGVRLPLHDGTPSMTYGLAVSDDYFALLGAQMQRGRAFGPADAREPVVVLSASGWRRLTGADPDAVGSTLRLGAATYTVVGIAAEEFRGIDVIAPQYWLPREALALAADDGGYTSIGGVLRAGMSAEQAQAALQTVLDAQRLPDDMEGPARVLVNPRTSLFDSVEADVLRKAAVPVFAAFLLVLLVACANLANLMLARTAARRRELAVRLALGASRWRVVRHLLVESALVAGAAGALGTVLCGVSIAALQRYVFSGLGAFAPDLVPAPLEAGRVLFTLALALVATLAIGIAPALDASRQNPAQGTRDAPTGVRQRRMRNGLLVTQLAASVVLLVVSSLIVANARRADGFEPGFDAARIVDVTFPHPTDRLARELGSIPLVRSVSAVARVPLYGQRNQMPVRVGEQDVGVAFNQVDARYFDTLGIPLLHGRTFFTSETESPAQVAVVSVATAQRLWPEGNAVGRVFDVLPELSSIPAGRYEVVGIAADVASGLFLEGVDRTMVYFPVAPADAGGLLARIDGGLGEVRAQLVDACTRADPAVLCEPVTLAEVVASQRVPLTVSATVASALGFAALLISCVGLYGVVSFAVAQRTREIGVRIACGAPPSSVVRFVLAGAVRQVGIGLAIGLPLCIAASVAIAANIELVQVFDLRSYVGMPALLAVVALAAALVPARRAARVAPAVVLREDG